MNRNRKWNEVYGWIVGIYPVLREYLNVIFIVVFYYCGWRSLVGASQYLFNKSKFYLEKFLIYDGTSSWLPRFVNFASTKWKKTVCLCRYTPKIKKKVKKSWHLQNPADKTSEIEAELKSVQEEARARTSWALTEWRLRNIFPEDS
jgi:hypothetical protein